MCKKESCCEEKKIDNAIEIKVDLTKAIQCICVTVLAIMAIKILPGMLKELMSLKGE